MAKTVPPGRVDALTGVRILAAAGVFLSHLTPPEEVPFRIRTFMDAGYNGVTLFFVLSGFVLAWNYVDRVSLREPRSLWSYFAARIARVYPLYLFALLWVATPFLVTGGVESYALLHLFALQPWHPDVHVAYALNGPAWSIGVEFFLYLTFPFVIVALRRLRGSPSMLFAVGGAVMLLVAATTLWFTMTGKADLPWTDPASDHRWLYRSPLLRVGDFSVGVIAAMLLKCWRPPTWLPRVGLLVAVVGSVGAMQWRPLLGTAWSFDAAYLPLAALLVWSLAAGPDVRFSRVLGSKPFVVAGEASFAFYLLHAPLLTRLEYADVPTVGAWAVIAVLNFVMIMLAAIGANLIIERPCQLWLRRRLVPRRRVPVEDLDPKLPHEQVLI